MPPFFNPRDGRHVPSRTCRHPVDLRTSHGKHHQARPHHAEEPQGGRLRQRGNDVLQRNRRVRRHSHRRGPQRRPTAAPGPVGRSNPAWPANQESGWVRSTWAGSSRSFTLPLASGQIGQGVHTRKAWLQVVFDPGGRNLVQRGRLPVRMPVLRARTPSEKSGWAQQPTEA